jgi:DNA-binding transcriptional LysR family regulator
MVEIENWRSFIGRRLRLRDLHVFFAVVEHGSMVKAAAHLRISQPAVSQVIAELEHVLGVNLFDRGPKGAELTLYGRAVLDGGMAAFDELAQTLKQIKFLANPTLGEVRVGCPETVAAILLPVVKEISRTHPEIVVKVHNVVAPMLDLPELRSRELDLALIRTTNIQSRMPADEDLEIEVLFNDESCIVVNRESPWARKRNISLADIAAGEWVLPPPGSSNREAVEETLKAAGCTPPKVATETFSVQLRVNLLTNIRALTVLPRSMMNLYARSMSLKVLPIPLLTKPWPVVMVTLENRTINPTRKLFMDAARSQLKRL